MALPRAVRWRTIERMNIDSIREAAKKVIATTASSEANVPLRTFMRFRAGGYPSHATLERLAAWADAQPQPKKRKTKDQK